MLYHGNEKRLHVGNEIKLGIWIPMIESRTCIISWDKGIKLLTLKVLTITEVIVECVGVSMDLEVPLLIIDLRGVSIMSALFTNRRVTHLRDTDTIWSKCVLEKRIAKRWNYFNGHRNYFGWICWNWFCMWYWNVAWVLCECLLIKVINKILNK